MLSTTQLLEENQKLKKENEKLKKENEDFRRKLFNLTLKELY